MTFSVPKAFSLTVVAASFGCGGGSSVVDGAVMGGGGDAENGTTGKGGADAQAMAAACGSGRQSLLVEIDGKALQPIGLIGSMETPQARAFGLEGVNHSGTLETNVGIAASGLVLGQQSAGEMVSFRYRVYDQKTNPYTLVEQVANPKVSGTILVAAIAEKYGDRTCGTFDVTSTAGHVFHLRGAFDQTYPFPRPGAAPPARR